MNMKKIIPLSIPNFKGNEKKYVNEALDEGWVSTGGAYITKFEDNLANYLGVEKVACCQSGTSALHLSLIECDIKPEDLVLVPTVTFIAAVNPVRYMHAEPVFIDCDDSLCMDPNKLEDFCNKECKFIDNKLIHNITKKHVKAIVVVHVFGNIADMDKIMRIASMFNLRVVEDATEALGTRYLSGEYKDKMAGTIGDFGALSFNGNKIITTGGGGAVIARDLNTTMHMKFLSTQAKTDPHYYIHDEVGYNYRMTNLQAALGVAQLEYLDEFIKNKNRFYDIYQKEFKDFEYGKILGFRDETYSNKWFISLLIDIDKIDCELKVLIEDMKQKGVETRPIWGLIHMQRPYVNCMTYGIEKSLYYYKRVINIPSSTQLLDEDIKTASRIIKETILEHIN